MVLISIDTLRSDRLPIYGYRGVETPAIERLRRDGVLFERAYSHTPLTLPSHATMMTGLLPAAHGVRDNRGYPFAAGERPFLPRILARAGYRTAGAVSAYVLHRESGFGAEDFEVYDDRLEAPGEGALGGVSRPGAETLRAVAPWLEEAAGGPFFLFFHLFEPHAPYAPPEPWASRVADPYDGEVAAADAVVGELLAILERLGVYEEALVLLLSDHGEGLGDHGEEEHGVLLYREALQVPLVVKLPGGRRAGATVAAPVGLADVLPTVLDLLGLPVPEGLDGRSLAPAIEGDAAGLAEREIYAETVYPRLHYGWSDLASLVAGRHHLIAGPRRELYDLESDPAERRDLAADERRRARDLAQRLETYRRPLAPPAAVDPEARARLAALGYLSAPAAASGPLPDPRERIGALARSREALERIRRGELEEGTALLRGVLEENPGMVDGWQTLADVERRRGRLAEAAQAYRRAFEASGGDPELGRALAAAEHALARELAEAGRFAEALETLRPLAEDGDLEAMTAAGQVYSEAGDQGRAEAALGAVLARDPGNVPALELLALVRLRQARWADARDAARRALDRDPERAAAWNRLGVARHQLGERAAALDAWERATELDPRDFDALYNLGTRAAELGQRDRARRALERFVRDAPPERYARDLEPARALLQQLNAPPRSRP